MKAAVALCVAIVIAGCNTVPLPHRQTDQARDVTGDCFSALSRDERFAALVEPLGLNLPRGAMPGVDLLNNSKKPTPTEAAALVEYSKARSTCVEIGRTSRAAALPGEAVALLESGYIESHLMLARLQQGEISYGQAAQEKMAANAKFGARWEEIRGRVQASSTQQRQFNQQQFMNGLMMMHMGMPRPAPMAPSINCTTRNSFGTLITECR